MQHVIERKCMAIFLECRTVTLLLRTFLSQLSILFRPSLCYSRAPCKYFGVHLLKSANPIKGSFYATALLRRFLDCRTAIRARWKFPKKKFEVHKPNEGSWTYTCCLHFVWRTTQSDAFAGFFLSSKGEVVPGFRLRKNNPK